MNCPTCDGAMDAIITPGSGVGAAPLIRWCPRCGTMKCGPADPCAPKLVERCREFRKTIRADYGSHCSLCRVNWKLLGLAECIHTPAAKG
jgi:hypothetical protein